MDSGCGGEGTKPFTLTLMSKCKPLFSALSSPGAQCPKNSRYSLKAYKWIKDIDGHIEAWYVGRHWRYKDCKIEGSVPFCHRSKCRGGTQGSKKCS